MTTYEILSQSQRNRINWELEEVHKEIYNLVLHGPLEVRHEDLPMWKQLGKYCDMWAAYIGKREMVGTFPDSVQLEVDKKAAATIPPPLHQRMMMVLRALSQTLEEVRTELTEEGYQTYPHPPLHHFIRMEEFLSHFILGFESSRRKS